MSSQAAKWGKAIGVAALGVVICAGLIFVGEWDDAPGASVLGILLMLGSLVLGARIARRKT